MANLVDYEKVCDIIGVIRKQYRLDGSSKYFCCTGEYTPEEFIGAMIATFSMHRTFVVGSGFIGSNSVVNLLELTNEVEIVQSDYTVRKIISDIVKSNSNSDIALITTTSGSTSTPKTVCFSYQAVLTRIQEVISTYHLNENTQELIILPLESTAIVFDQLLPSIFAGASLSIFCGNFNPVHVMKMLQGSFDYVGITPSIIRLLGRLGFQWTNCQLKHVAIGGEKVDGKLLSMLKRSLPQSDIFSMYGLSETAGAIFGCPDQKDVPVDSLGKKLPGVEVKLYEDEILVKTDADALGYLENNKIIPLYNDNWFHTGDLGRIDSEGNVYVIGRKKSVIIRGGVNIYAEEVESVINNIDGVISSRVYAVPGKILGEDIAAEVYVLENKKINLEYIKETLGKALDPLKIPTVWSIREKPKFVGLGKVKRYE